MPKQFNIRWSDKDLKELERTVRNYNAKLRRVKSDEPSKASFLPDRLSVKSLKSKIVTRRDLNRILNSAKRFSRRGAERVVTTRAGVTLTKFELKELQIKQRVINRGLAKQAKQVTPESGAMSQLETRNLKPKRPITQIPERDFAKAVEVIERQIRSTYTREMQERYIENYIKGLENVLGGNADDIIKFVKSQPPETIVNESLGNPFLSVDFVYGLEDAQLKAERILEEWQIAIE